ncbi:MAG TPA: hypothetical protein DHV03_05795 [Alphaproteobacteria bacterium]|nr:hypothetical protein [Alphaproteobacteria bacterium]
MFILVLLVITVGGSLLLYAWRAPRLKSEVPFAALSREGLLVVNNLFLVVSMAVVLLGTLFPLFAEAFGYKVSVGAPFFNLTFVPLMTPLMLLVPFGPMSAWKKMTLERMISQLSVAMIMAAVAGIGLYIMKQGGPWWAYGGFVVAIWLMFGALTEPFARAGAFKVPVHVFWSRFKGLPASSWSAAVAHFGLGVMVAGIVGISAFAEEKILAMGQGDQITIGGYDVRFEGAGQAPGPNYDFLRGKFVATNSRGHELEMFPEKRYYRVKDTQTTEAAIHFDGLGDLYIALGERQDDGRWAVRAYYNPGVDYIWFGCLIMAMGGTISVVGRRYRRSKQHSSLQAQTA